MGVLPGAGMFYFEGSEVGCLLIHGFTGTPQNIRPLGDFLARRGLSVLAPRLAGHGTSVDEFETTGPADWIASVEAGLEFISSTAWSSVRPSPPKGMKPRRSHRCRIAERSPGS